MFLVEKNLYLTKEFILLVGKKQSIKLPRTAITVPSSLFFFRCSTTDSNNFTFLRDSEYIFHCVVLQNNILYDYINIKYQWYLVVWIILGYLIKIWFKLAVKYKSPIFIQKYTKINTVNNVSGQSLGWIWAFLKPQNTTSVSP